MMSTAFDVDTRDIATYFSDKVPQLVDGLYEIPPNQTPFEHVEYRSEVNQYSCELPLSIKRAMFALSPTANELFADTEYQEPRPWRQHFIQTGENGSDVFAQAMNHATAQMKQLFEQADSPYSGVDPQQLERMINAIDLDRAHGSLEEIITETTALVGRHSIILQHPDCIAHLHTPPLMPAIIAESMMAALNQSMDSWDQAPAATYVEQKVVNWMCDKFQLGLHADGIFTSGGTQSNLMGLLLARDRIADTLAGHSIQKQGLPSFANKLRILCSKKSHFTVQKSASLLGLGEQSVCCVDTHQNGTIKIDALENEIDKLHQQGLIPFAVVGTAGTTDHGAIDDLTAIAQIAQHHQLWFHVDSAYGGALILSRYKTRLAGIEQADSVSVDFHKLFYQTISCGALLLKDKANFKYLLHHADYLNREHDELPNLVDKSISTTKRFDALKVFMTMQNVGPDVLGEMVEHLIEQTQCVAQKIEQYKGM